MNEDFLEGCFEGAWKTKRKGDEDGLWQEMEQWKGGRECQLPAPTLGGLWWRIVEVVRWVK